MRTAARSRGIDAVLLDAIGSSNDAHFERVVTLVAAGDPRSIGILGMGFKPGVDDAGASVSLRLAGSLERRGYKVSAYDRHLPGTDDQTMDLPPFSSIARFRVGSLRELVAAADTLVLCHDDDGYLEELRGIIRPSQRVVDLAGVGAMACGATDYVGVAW